MAGALKFLDDIAFGLSTHALSPVDPTITIEMHRDDAERFLFKIMKEFESFIVKHHIAPMVLQLGTVFTYRGVKFRIVEKA